MCLMVVLVAGRPRRGPLGGFVGHGLGTSLRGETHGSRPRQGERGLLGFFGWI